MKKHVMVLLLGICLIGIPGVSEAALDWQIRWSDLENPQVAKVYIFNPESTRQSFSLEIGDIAETSSVGPHAPYIILGQDVSLHLQPGERKIFDILVYQDTDPYDIYASQGTEIYTLGTDSYHILLEGRPASDDSRQSQYPISSRGINLVPRPTQEEKEYNYRNERGYWKLILVDHDHVAEQLIRTGNRMGASHTSIQQAILFYTQGSMALNGQAKSVFYTAFPELDAPTTELICPLCAYCVTFVTNNASQSTLLKAGDVLGPNDPMLSPVVFAEYLSDAVSPGTAGSGPLLVTLSMKRQGVPPVQSEYFNIIGHDSQLERVIQIGLTESYNYCAIQDVVWYLNKEVGNLTGDGQALWDRVKEDGKNNSGGRTPCFGGRPAKIAELKAEPENWKNLAALVGMVLPFGVIFKRKGRK